MNHPFRLRNGNVTLFAVVIAILTGSAALASPTITFTSHPYDTAATAASGVVAQAYSYDADAISSDGSAVEYSLRYGPAGMSVDQSTGVISWTPASSGTHLVQIRASLAGDPSITAQQSWAILVTQCAGNTIISGTVVDQNNTPIANGTITARIVGSTTSPLAEVRGPITNGSYSLVVDQGNYVLQATGGFVGEWYPDAESFADAQQVSTTCGQTTTADFNVLQLPPRAWKYVAFGGRVVDSRADTVSTDIDMHLGVMPRWKWESTTQKWRLKMIATKDSAFRHAPIKRSAAGYSFENTFFDDYYVLFPFMISRDPETNTSGTVLQYYDYAASPIDATAITVMGDATLSDVNYLFASHSPGRQPESALLRTARMLDSAGEGLSGVVVALCIEQTSAGLVVDITRSFSVRTDDYFWMYLHPESRYILFGIPNDPGYAPGYYVDGDTVAITADDGSILDTDVLEYDTQNPHILQMRSSSSDSGRSELRGNVHVPGGIASKGGGARTLGATDPLVGAFIVALDSLGGVASYTFSNDDGSYVLEGLPAGTFTIITGKPGYATQQSRAKLSGMGEILENSVLLEQNIVSRVNGPKRNLSTATARPNPASSSLELGFDAKAGSARISVATMLGQQVLASAVPTTSGRNTVSLDVRTLSSGTYLVTIKGDGVDAAVAVTVTR